MVRIVLSFTSTSQHFTSLTCTSTVLRSGVELSDYSHQAQRGRPYFTRCVSKALETPSSAVSSYSSISQRERPGLPEHTTWAVDYSSQAVMLPLIVVAVSASNVSQLAIMQRLLVDYDHTMHPSHPALRSSDNQSYCDGAGNADITYVSTFVSRIHSVDQIAKSYEFEGTTTYIWHDWRLDFSALSCLKVLNFGHFDDAGGIWQPGIYLGEALKESFGGASGAMATLGEALKIHRNGTVSWTRHTRMKVSCKTMDFSRLPFDEQYCLISFGTLRYLPEEVTVQFPSFIDSSNTDTHLSGEWLIRLQSARTVNVGVHSVARYCVLFSRQSNSDTLTIIFSVLLVCASYSGAHDCILL